MPAPAGVTNLTVTPAANGSPQVTIAWQHTGTDLDRFELLRRKTGTSDPWESVAMAPKADFGAAPNFSVVTASRPGYTWSVAALNAAGERSI